MASMIGALNVQDITNGYWFVIVENPPADWLAEMRGERVLIPGSEGLFTPSDNFEAERLVIRYHGIVMGAGATHELARASFASRMAALKSACASDTRADVTLVEDAWTAQAGLVRFEGPGSEALGGEGREFDIVFEATDPPEWTAS